MPARSTGQFSAESSQVFRQPQSYSSDEYSYSCEDTAFYYLHLKSSKKTPKIPVEAAAAQRGSAKRVPHQHLSWPAAQGRAQGLNLPRGSAEGELRAAHPGLPGSGCPAQPSGAGPQDGCGKWPQKPGRGWRTRLPGAGALPTEQHAGLKPRHSRRPRLPRSPPAPRCPRGGAERGRPAVALRGHGSPLPCPGSPWRRGAAPGSSGRRWREAAGAAGWRGGDRRSGRGGGRRGVSDAWWRGPGAPRGREARRDRPGRASRCPRCPAPEAPPRQSAAPGAAAGTECGPGAGPPAWENPGKPACPGRRAAGKAPTQRFLHRGRGRSMSLFWFTVVFLKITKPYSRFPKDSQGSFNKKC